MKLSLLLLVFEMLLSAASVYSQTWRISMNEKDISIGEVLKRIEDTSDFRFFYEETKLNIKNRVDITVNQGTIEEVLNHLFDNNHIDYKVLRNHFIVLKPKEEPKRSPSEAIQQQKSVNGKITDSSGTSLPGVSVVVKGTTIGVISDSNGMYLFSNILENATLKFSFIGRKMQEINVSGRSMINIVLEEETIVIEEVVAIGYETVRKSDLTGSLVSVSSGTLNAFPSQNLEQALQGRAAGLQITSINRAPGGEVKIRIRGGTSINAGNSPLFVVDGFPGSTLPPSENIASVEILKDASATAIYGSRGANGVILVTTKKGIKGKTIVEINTSSSLQQLGKTYDLLNGIQFARYINDYFKATGNRSVPFPDPSSVGEGTNWQDEIFRTGMLQNYQVSVSGGNEKALYYVSSKYYGQDGSIINSSYKQYSVNSNFEFNLLDKSSGGVRLSFLHDLTRGPLSDGSEGSTATGAILRTALINDPTQPVKNSLGKYTISPFGTPTENAVAIANEIINDKVGDYFTGNAFLQYKITEGLSFRTTLSANLTSGRMGGYVPGNNIFTSNSDGGRATLSGDRSVLILNENYLSFEKTIANNHKFKILGGYSYQSSRSENWWVRNERFISDSFTFWNLGAGTNPSTPTSSLTEWTIASVFGRVNYNLNDRYLLTFTGRYDGSSRFGEDNKWGFFPSGAIAWNIKQEPFMQSFNKLSNLKLRASYGITGNTEIGSYRSFATLINILSTIGGVPVNAIQLGSVANGDLGWEKTSQTDIGLDVSFFQNRINLTADYYVKTTDNLLYSLPLPAYSGFTSSLQNQGSVENRGWEFSLNTVNLNRQLKWNTDFNISFNKNKILELPGGDVIYSSTPPNLIGNMQSHILRVGESIGAMYGYIFQGVYQTGDDFSAEPLKVSGNEKLKDFVLDGIINSKDRTIIGDPAPDFIFGLTNDFEYKNFDFNIFLQGTIGNDIYNFTRMEMETLNGFTNTTTAYLNAWTPTNTNTIVPKVGANAYIISNRWIEDGSFLRVKNITLGYNLTARFMQKINLEKFRIYVGAQNLFTLTKYSGFDPDVSWRDNNTSSGLDYNGYPNVKSYTIGFNLGF